MNSEQAPHEDLCQVWAEMSPAERREYLLMAKEEPPEWLGGRVRAMFPMPPA